MFATVIGRLYERSYGEIEVKDTFTFSDCEYSSYYGEYAGWAAEQGIIEGYGDGRFGPDDMIDRQQMVTILYRFADYLGFIPTSMDTKLDYPDCGSIAHYAKDGSLYCQTTGIISGFPDGSFAPGKTANRSQVAAIIQRFIEEVLK
jgi:hypothetical protein